MEIGHAVRALVTGVPHIFLGGQSSVRAGTERLASVRLGVTGVKPILIESLVFSDGGSIPVRYTADGKGLPPPLEWQEVPRGTRSLVLLAEDPDAPTPLPFVHWIAVMPPNTRSLGINVGPTAIDMGLTSLLRTGWIGCAPPRGDLAHHYHFQLFALNREIHTGPPLGRTLLLRQMKGHVIGFGEVIGTYERDGRH